MREPSSAEAIFFAALEKRTDEERAAYLDAACGEDRELRQRVERLLAAHPQVGSFLEPAPAGTAAYQGPAEGVGSVIAGKYKLLQQIGEGGMGSVFMAEQTRPVKRMVAFKVIKAGMDSKQVLARFESERQALALMDHPNIAKVLDAGTTERGQPYFVMELVKGVPLTQFCDARQLSVGDRLKIFQQICHAVQHAHQKGIIHRDLKPTNILVESHDGRPVPKIIDFGLAKAMNALPLTERSLFTNFGAMLGTPLYMAPEQAEFSAIDVDTRADVYALGVILYELLTGTTPLEKKRLAAAAWDEVRRVIKEEDPPKPSTRLSTSEARASIAAQRQSEPHKLGKFLRGDLDWIVMKALAKERDRRYDTANALALDVERFLNDEPVSAGPPTLRYKFRKFVHRNRGQVTAAALLLFALVAGVAVSTWQAIRATNAEGEMRHEQAKTVEALNVAEKNRQEADDQRKKAETQVASLAVDIDLKYCEDGEIALGLLRLAETLRTIPEHAKELRECVALNILAWGQRFRPAWTLGHDGYDVKRAELSPDGLTVLTAGADGAVCLWDSVTGKHRATLGEPLRFESPPVFQDPTRVGFSKDGKTAFSVIGYDPVIRLWDVATEQLRFAIDPSMVGDFRLSNDGSLVVTACKGPLRSQQTAQFWNGSNGQRLRKLEFATAEKLGIGVSPDGKWVLIAHEGKVDVFAPEDGIPPKRLPGSDYECQPESVAFSPSGQSAVTMDSSRDAIHWWKTADWQVQRTIDLKELSRFWPLWEMVSFPVFITDEMLVLGWERLGEQNPQETICAFIQNLSKPIIDVCPLRRGLTLFRSLTLAQAGDIHASSNGRFVVIDSHVYDALNGRRLHLPRGHKFHPELRHFTEDGRFTEFHQSYVVDLAADQKIVFGRGSSDDWNADGRYLKSQETWVALAFDMSMIVLHKTDADLDAEPLHKWCQVITRGKLDERGQFSKFDEATWEKSRQELARLLDANPQAQSLRSAVSDPLYWLRQEIKDSSTPLPLLERLVAAEPTWSNYSKRSGAHANEKHWEQAIRDELEAARLAGERYWLQGSSWFLAAQSVQAPGRPREQYELALRLVQAQTRAGVPDERKIDDRQYRPRRNVITGLGLFRLGQYADALAALKASDLGMVSEATGVLMSRWTVLTYLSLRGNFPPSDRRMTIREYKFDPVDLLVRAMCYHHLRRPEQAKACLDQARSTLGRDVRDEDQRGFLREAESLIEDKVQP